MFDLKNYVMKIISQSPSQRLVRLQEKWKLIIKNLYIHKFFFNFSVFQYTSHQPISVADLGWNVNDVKTFDIITSMKSMFFRFCFWGGFAGLQPPLLLGAPIVHMFLYVYNCSIIHILCVWIYIYIYIYIYILYIKMNVCTLYKSTFLNRSEPNFAHISPVVWKRP